MSILNPLYHIRLTPTSELKTLSTFLNLLSDTWIYGKEYSNKRKLHYHIVIGTSKTPKQISSLISEQLGDSIPTGNGGRSVELVRDSNNIFPYVVKDGDIQFQGYSQEFIDDIKSRSFQKIDFKSELEKVETKFIKDLDYKLPLFIRDVINIYLKCNRTITRHAILTRCETLYLKQSEYNVTHYAINLAEQIHRNCDTRFSSYTNGGYDSIENHPYDLSALDY